MVMYSGHPGIGAVGGRLLFEDGRLQHVGVVLRERRPARPPLPRLLAATSRGYSNSVLVAQNCLAVTGACLMTPRAAVRARSAASAPTFPVNYNDIDYCLKLRARGQRVVYDPDTLLYHFESSSRSTDVDGVGEGAADRTLAAADRSRPLLQPEPQVRYAAAQLPPQMGDPPLPAPAGP